MPINLEYPGAECPDCGEPIDDDKEAGDECDCGHIFSVDCTKPMSRVRHAFTVLENTGGYAVKRTVVVTVAPNGICVSFPGFGDYTSADGAGEPVFVEYQNGVPVVHVWADINREGSTHVIRLDGAAEKLRHCTKE